MTNKEFMKFDDDNFILQNNDLANSFSEKVQISSTQIKNSIITNTTSPIINEAGKLFYCEPCNLKLNSILIYQQHLAGTKHQKKVSQIQLINQYNKEQSVFGKINVNSTTFNNQNIQTTNSLNKNNQSFRCDHCDLTLTSQISYDQHINGRNHRKKVENLNNNNISSHSPNSITIQSIIQTSMTNDDQTNKNTNSYNCDICQMFMSGKDQLAAHLIGKKHMKKLASLNSNNFVSNPSTDTIDTKYLINNNNQPYETNYITYINNQNTVTNNMEFNETSSIQVENKETVQQQIDHQANNSITNNVTSNGDKLYCDICNVKATSQDHLNSHFSGRKHLAKLKCYSNIPICMAKKKTNDDDSKFDHLNIAWAKYEIDQVKKMETNYLYDFYCPLCKKLIQRKLQLVDHLKSKRHHAKIIAARNKKEDEGSKISDKQQNIINKPTFKAKNKKKFQQCKRNRPIQFVPATNQFAATNLGNQPMNSTTINPNTQNLSNYGYGYSDHQNLAMPNYSYLKYPVNKPNTNLN